ncbi:MAG: exodeoxyribonuclease VII small subunit [Clostridia bacterium]|nr:exodeoxyribonuclease VII small subunit [Clostridia bacterium]
MKYTFEEGMEKLEALVLRLEKGDMDLEESFKAYHEASALYKELSGMLDEGEARIIEIMKSGEKDITEEISK